MPVARALAVGLVGITGHVVEVEADLGTGLPGFVLVGLPDTALQEARDRVRAAVTNCGETWPATRKITIGLSPATLPKQGSGFDLALAASVLAAAGELPAGALDDVVLLGELGLDGRVRPVRGVLPGVIAAARAGVRRIVVPTGNAAEAVLVEGIEAHAVASLPALLRLLRARIGRGPLASAECSAVVAATTIPPAVRPPSTWDGPDLAEVVGQVEGRTAIEVAAAGGHHVSLVGPPGAGKTMLAERMPGLLPPLSTQEALEVTAVHSVAGVLAEGRPLVDRPPYQAPHHSASVAALVGGGSGIARPGALSLAHRGILFLDEAPEFPSGVLDAMRQPLERGEIVLVRSSGIVRYPARVQLVLAANPCPCGRFGPGGDCTCTPLMRRRYLGRLSGPLLDRVDLRVTVGPVPRAVLLDPFARAEPTATVAARVAAARGAAGERLAGTGWRTNAEVPGHALRVGRFAVPRVHREVLDRELERGRLTARGLDRVLRVAWTLADLAGRSAPDQGDVGVALQLRSGLAEAA